VCYNCGKSGYFIAQCPYKRKEDNDKKKFDKSYKKDKKFTKKKPYKLMSVKNETQVMRVLSQKVMTW
jgi:hypothetical protein